MNPIGPEAVRTGARFGTDVPVDREVGDTTLFVGPPSSGCRDGVDDFEKESNYKLSRKCLMTCLILDWKFCQQEETLVPLL